MGDSTIVVHRLSNFNGFHDRVVIAKRPIAARLWSLGAVAEIVDHNVVVPAIHRSVSATIWLS
jgi:hypothetical protein